MSAPAVTRAREDVREGRLWMARDRLPSYVAAAHTDTEALELLGSVLYQMGDLPSAAKFWMMTERRGEDFDRSLQALQQRFPRPRSRLDYLRLRGPLEQYPRVARERIDALAAQAFADDGRGLALRAPTVVLPYA